jgi:hypothetical protein
MRRIQGNSDTRTAGYLRAFESKTPPFPVSSTSSLLKSSCSLYILFISIDFAKTWVLGPYLTFLFHQPILHMSEHSYLGVPPANRPGAVHSLSSSSAKGGRSSPGYSRTDADIVDTLGQATAKERPLPASSSEDLHGSVPPQ